MDEIVDQGQVDSFCDVTVGDNLIEKMQVSITVKDGVILSIDIYLREYLVFFINISKS